tara:strand:- start:321 stop:626 length:306 start_codon:yes stop_codon:yes gene_type:complete
MNGYVVICLVLIVVLIIANSTYKYNKKQDRLLSIRRKVVLFYGLGGFYYEYELVTFGYFYCNSKERLSGEWQVARTFADGSCNENTEKRGYNAISFSKEGL